MGKKERRRKRRRKKEEETLHKRPSELDTSNIWRSVAQGERVLTKEGEREWRRRRRSILFGIHRSSSVPSSLFPFNEGSEDDVPFAEREKRRKRARHSTEVRLCSKLSSPSLSLSRSVHFHFPSLIFPWPAQNSARANKVFKKAKKPFLLPSSFSGVL